MKRLKPIAIVILFALALLQSFALAAIDIKKIVTNYSRSVVKILTLEVTQDRVVPTSIGTGFIVTEDGVIFTNRHVIVPSKWGPNYTEGMGEIVVQVWNSAENTELYLARVDYYSAEFDGAQISLVSDIDGRPITRKFSPVDVADSDKLTSGEEVAILGFPYQGEQGTSALLSSTMTVTRGIISGFDYQLGLIKTDARIDAGNSGGPVFSESGKVIGIATAKYRETGLGLAGGINGMYWIATERVVEKTGVKKPKRSLRPTVYRAQEKVYTSPPPSMAGTSPPESRESPPRERRKSSSEVVVSGIVLSADTGQPVDGAVLALAIMRGETPEIFSSGTCDRKGLFVMAPAVEPGPYIFVAVAKKYKDVVERVDIPKFDWYVEVTMSRK